MSHRLHPSLPSALLAQLSPLITAKMGLNFPSARWHEFERGLGMAAAAAGYTDVAAFCHSLLAASLTASQIATLSPHLTIGETYFLREKPVINALRECLFPELIRARNASTRQLRIWSAGCCTGEEAYSVAILLSELLPNLADWRLSILATDINAHFLQKAQAGVYGEWSFRDVPPNFKERYFTQTGKNSYQLHDALKKLVKFNQLNLAGDDYPSAHNQTTALDVIFCRNVLMYFSPEQAKQTVRKFYEALVDGGWLVVGLGEASHQLFADFEMVHLPGAILYRKASNANRADATQSGATELLPSWETRRHAQWHDYDLETTSLFPPLAPSGIYPKSTPAVRGARELSHRVAPTAAPPQAAQAIQPQSHASYDQGHFAEAETQAQSALAQKPDDTAELVLMARICGNQGRLDEALAWCNRCIAADRLDVRGHYLYATIQQARGEMDEAAKALHRTLYLQPEFVMAHFALGYLAQRQGKIREAEKHFANLLLILDGYRPDELVPEADGLTAGRLAEMVRAASPVEHVR